MSRDSPEEPGTTGGPKKRGRARRKPAVRWLQWILAVLAVALVGLLATQSSGDDPSAGGVTDDGLVAEIQLSGFDGKPFALSDYSERPIVLNFWASWCPPCAAEMPAFERVHNDLEGEVAFIGVNQRDQRSAANDLARRTGVSYRLVEDPDGRLFDAFGGVGMPTTVFIDSGGSVSRIVAGPLSEEQLRAHISEIGA